jgi:hypothetical protein
VNEFAVALVSWLAALAGANATVQSLLHAFLAGVKAGLIGAAAVGSVLVTRAVVRATPAMVATVVAVAVGTRLLLLLALARLVSAFAPAPRPRAPRVRSVRTVTA